MKICLSIDLESWVFPSVRKFESLNISERKKIDNEYILRSTYDLLNILAKTKTKLTFFSITQIYQWYPKLFTDILNEGHEIGYHSYSHTNLFNRSKLIEDLNLSKIFLSEIKPKGFRAPFMKFDENNFDILNDFGFEYSSTIYGNNLDIMPTNKINFLEKQVSILKLKSFNIPIGSGYFIGLLQNNYLKLIETRVKKNKKFNCFIHNWQVTKESKGFPDINYLIKNPLYIPYSLNIKQTFVDILNNFMISKVNEF